MTTFNLDHNLISISSSFTTGKNDPEAIVSARSSGQVTTSHCGQKARGRPELHIQKENYKVVIISSSCGRAPLASVRKIRKKLRRNLFSVYSRALARYGPELQRGIPLPTRGRTGEDEPWFRNVCVLSSLDIWVSLYGQVPYRKAC